MLRFSFSATVAVPTTTTGGVRSLRSLDGVAGTQLNSVATTDSSCCLNELPEPLSCNYLLGNIRPLMLFYFPISFESKCLAHKTL